MIVLHDVSELRRLENLRREFVANVSDIIGAEATTVAPVTVRLAELKESENVLGVNTQAVAESREVTILADRAVPFEVIKKIMSTCTGEGYENVSLAVIQKPSKITAT